MFKIFEINGITTTIEISEEGKVTYAVSKNKTTFDLNECESFAYEFEATDEKVDITEEIITESEGVKPWLWIVISKGEERIDYNNNWLFSSCWSWSFLFLSTTDICSQFGNSIFRDLVHPRDGGFSLQQNLKMNTLQLS